MTNDLLEHILQKFPYASEPDQLEVLKDFFILNAGNNATEIKEQLNIHHSTQRRIRTAWRELTSQQQAYLWNQMSQHILTQPTDQN